MLLPPLFSETEEQKKWSEKWSKSEFHIISHRQKGGGILPLSLIGTKYMSRSLSGKKPVRKSWKKFGKGGNVLKVTQGPESVSSMYEFTFPCKFVKAI